MVKKYYKEVERLGKRRKLHRVAMSEYLGRDLADDEVVHHKDGDIHNNDINNLELMKSEAHTSFHGAGSKRPRKKEFVQYNKISEEKRLEILKIWKSGQHNCTKIGRFLNLNGYTVKRYVVKAINDGEI